MRPRRIIVPIAIAALLTACGAGRQPDPAPAPARTDVPDRPPPIVSTSAVRMIEVCVVQGGTMTDAVALYDTVTGDTSFGDSGWPVATPAYAVDQPWFVHNEPITLGAWRYLKYGLPRAPDG